MKKGLIIGIVIVIILFVIGIVIYPYIFSSNNAKNSCSVMDDSKCNKKCNTNSDCKKIECSCINKLETMNTSGGSCNTFVAFDCKCENNKCKSESIIPNNNKSVCGNGICELGEGPACPSCDTPGNCGACATGSCPQDCIFSCKEDIDCIKIKADCCGCGGGGKATAINKNYNDKWMDDSTIDCGVCAAVMSTDSSCFKEPKCINDQCLLVDKSDKYSCNINSDCKSTCGEGCVNKEWAKDYRDPCDLERAWDCSCVNSICYTDGKSPYTCPTQKTIDCMPAVPPNLSQFCSGEYHNWIIENCNVSFSY